MISLKSKAPAASKVEEGETKGSAGDSKAEPNGTGVAKKKTIWGVGRGRGKKKARGGKQKTMADLRLVTDTQELDLGGITSMRWPDTKKLTEMTLTVTPDTGYWKNATYEFNISVPPEYPHKPPKVTCATKIFHPNIDLQGAVCLNILRGDWKPVFDLNTVVNGVTFLFYEPNPDDPLNHDAARLFRENEPEFRQQVLRSLRGGTVQGERFPRLV